MGYCFKIPVLAALICSPAFAQISDHKGLAIAFVGHCVSNVGRLDKVEAAASALGYKELTGDQAKMFAPQDPDAEYRGWIVQGEVPDLYIVGISRSISDGVKMTSCVIANTNVDTDKTLSELKNIISLGPLQYDGVETGHRNRFWDASLIAPNTVIVLTDAKKLGIEGGTFALSSPSEE